MAGGPSALAGGGGPPLSGRCTLSDLFLPASSPFAPSHPLPVSASPSMSHSFGESYRVGSTSGVHAITVFCSWDYKVTQRWATRLQHDNIRTQLKVSWGLTAPWGHGLPPLCQPPGATVCHPRVQGNTSWGPVVGLREGLPLLEGPVSSGPGRKMPPLCQLARTPSPPGSPGVQVRTVRSQSLAHGSLGQRVAELGLLEDSLLLGVPAVGFESRALSFDPAVGPSGSAPWLLVSEGTAVCRQHGSVGRCGAGHVPEDRASDGTTGRGTGGRREVSPGPPRPQASLCVGSMRPPGVWCARGQVPACLCPG